MARLTAAQKKAAEAAAALPKYDDVVEFALKGTVTYVYESYNNVTTFTLETEDGYEWEVNERELEDKNIKITVLESAPVFDEGAVIKDAEGCVFVRRGNEWVGTQDSCDEPTKPFRNATFA